MTPGCRTPNARMIIDTWQTRTPHPRIRLVRAGSSPIEIHLKSTNQMLGDAENGGKNETGDSTDSGSSASWDTTEFLPLYDPETEDAPIYEECIDCPDFSAAAPLQTSLDNSSPRIEKSTNSTSMMKQLPNTSFSASDLASTPPGHEKRSKVAKTLDGRLLCAAECAYALEAPYFAGVGFLAGSQVTKITKGVNACLVGRTTDGIVLAFRGTQSSSPLDWLQNAAIYLRAVDGGIPGRVHSGFYQAIRALYPALKRALLEKISKKESTNKTENIYLCGHSKGGSLASLAALLIHLDPDLPDPTAVFSYGAAKVGDAAFRTYFNETIKHHYTYENDLDLVPFLPPGRDNYQEMDAKMRAMVDDIVWSSSQRHHAKGHIWRYQAIGKRLYINDKQEIISRVTRDLDKQRIREIEKRTLLSFSEFRKAHCPACPDTQLGKESTCSGGYFCALAPEICQASHDSTPNSLFEASRLSQ